MEPQLQPFNPESNSGTLLRLSNLGHNQIQMIESNKFSTSDPHEFQEHMYELVGDNWVRPARGSDFHASVSTMASERLRFFSIKSPSISVRQDAALLKNLVINIPLASTFEIETPEGRLSCARDYYLRAPGVEFEFHAVTGCSVLGVCLSPDDTDRYARALNGPDSEKVTVESKVLQPSISSAQGLVKDMASLMALTQTGTIPANASYQQKELEDAILGGLVSLVFQDDACRTSSRQKRLIVSKTREYLSSCVTEPVSREELAAIAGVSIRTLSRAYREELGFGPMAHLKALRLDACYLYLLGADPESITVTEAASKYGFSHLGRFSSEFKQRFGEYPGQTIKR